MALSQWMVTAIEPLSVLLLVKDMTSSTAKRFIRPHSNWEWRVSRRDVALRLRSKGSD